MGWKKNRKCDVLEQVAANNGVTVDEVRREIRLAMAFAASDSDKSETPEEFVQFLSGKVKLALKQKVSV